MEVVRYIFKPLISINLRKLWAKYITRNLETIYTLEWHIYKTQPSYIIGKHFLQSTEFMKYSPTGPYIECHILFLSLISIYIIYFYVLCVIYSHSPTVTDIRYRDKAWGGECWNHSSALCFHPLYGNGYHRPPLDRSMFYGWNDK